MNRIGFEHNHIREISQASSPPCYQLAPIFPFSSVGELLMLLLLLVI